MSQSQEASATTAEPQPVARGGASNAGNGRGSQESGKSAASGQPKQSSTNSTSQKSGAPLPQKVNGTDGAPKSSWANIARAGPANGATAQEKPPQPTATGVKLPAGVSSVSSTGSSFQFGSIDPAELQQNNTQPSKPPSAPAAPPAKPAPPPTSKPVSFAAAASGNTGSKHQGNSGPPGAPQQHTQQQRSSNRPRAPQPVPAAIPQAAAIGSQQLFYLHNAYPQYMMAYNPGVSQPYYAAQFTQGSQYSSFQYGSPVQGGMQSAALNTVTSIPAPPPPPQPSSTASGSTYTAPTSPLPRSTPAAAVAAPKKKILRIENPDTHEALNLDEIAAATKPEKTDKPEPTNATTEKPASPEEKSAADVSKPLEPIESSKVEEKPEEVSQAVETNEAAKVEVSENEEKILEEGELAEEAEEEFTEEEQFEESALPDDGRKRYTTSVLLNIGQHPQCKELPPHVETATLGALLYGEGEKTRGPPGPLERDWKSGARGPPAPPGAPGMRGGRGNKRQQSGIDANTWERGKPLPSNQYGGRGPPPGMRMPSGPVPSLHKTDSAYKIGRVTTDDPEEEKAQKSLKSMLNKITPQNFEKITSQIVDKINERKKAKTLSGFIDQIFDKALIETTFSELYAKLVASLNPALPELEDEDGQPVQFRRTLLNKCQEEFETGALAMKAVAEREKREHDKPAEEQEDEDVNETEEAEEGEITEEQKEKRAAAEAKRQDKAAAEAEVKARKRMLGNIIFVGQLYRFGVLTETVMVSCIKQLLEETENPRSEDIECLCKLLTTVGRPLDNSTRNVKQKDADGNDTLVPTKDFMSVSFRRIENLSANEALDARHRFMLRDLIDLRENKWVLRRQAEGPKKIEEIHRDAAMERNRAQLMDRQSVSRGSRDIPRGSRFDNRVDAPIRTMNRVGSQDSLGSLRPGGRPAPPPRPAPPMGERPPAPPAKPESKPEPDSKVLTDEETQNKVKGLLAEVYDTSDVKEAILCVNELVDGQAKMSSVVELLFSVSLESKNTDWNVLRDLVRALGGDDIISRSDFEQGARQLLDKLDDLTVDVPKAPIQVGEVLSSLVANGSIDIGVIGKHILEADAEPIPEGEDSMMVQSGVALKVLGVLLRGLKEAKGVEEAAASWKSTGLDFKSYVSAEDREKPEAIEKFASDYGLADFF